MQREAKFVFLALVGVISIADIIINDTNPLLSYSGFEGIYLDRSKNYLITILRHMFG